MAEKVNSQAQGGSQQLEQSEGKSMNPPAFQLKAGAAIQKQDDKAKQVAPQKMTQGSGFKTYTNSSAIVTVPDGATGPLPILVIVGGKGGATKEFMREQIPPSFLKTHILSFSNYTTFYTSAVKPSIEQAMTSSGASGTYKALIGFSAGGYRVEGAKGDENWSIIGMVDAVATNGASYPGTVLHVWNLWGDNTLKNDARSLLHNRIVNGDVSGKSQRDTKVGHMGMPKRWFELYGDSL